MIPRQTYPSNLFRTIGTLDGPPTQTRRQYPTKVGLSTFENPVASGRALLPDRLHCCFIFIS